MNGQAHLKKLSEIMNELNLDPELYMHSTGVENLNVNLIKNKYQIIIEMSDKSKIVRKYQYLQVFRSER